MILYCFCLLGACTDLNDPVLLLSPEGVYDLPQSTPIVHVDLQYGAGEALLRPYTNFDPLGLHLGKDMYGKLGLKQSEVELIEMETA
jgi:hypothetical protein